MRLCTFLISIFFVLACAGQSIPPLKNFAPSDYGGENQNWQISQDGDQIVYVANSQGLLRYNGSRWDLYTLPNESMVRSVQVLGKSIYTGGYREFGFWTYNAQGELEYSSLSATIRDELLPDEEFWNILKSGPFIVFHSLERLYSYNPEEDTLQWVDTQSSLPSVFAIGQSVFFQKPGEGIFSLENGRADLQYDDDVLRTDEVIQMFEKEGRRLVLTKKNGFFTIAGDKAESWKTALNTSLSGVSIYSAIPLKDGGFALGTISDGLFLMDENGDIRFRIDLERGLRNNTVLSLYQSKDHTLWLGLDNGLSYLNLSSPILVFQDYGGYIGSVYATAEHEGILYMGTNQGLYGRAINSNGRFELIPGTEGQVWSLKLVGDTLFCGHHTGTYAISNGKAQRVASVPGTWEFTEIPGEPTLVLQGNYSGLHVLERLDGTWRLRNKVRGFENSSRFVEIFGNEIFVNHEYKGIFRLKPDPGFNEVKLIGTDTVHRGANSGLLQYGDQLLFAYREGVFSFDSESGSFVKDSILSKEVAKGGYVSGKLGRGDDGKRLWIFTREGISYATPGKLDVRPLIRSIPVGAEARKGISGYESVYGPGKEGKYIFGANNGFFALDINGVNEEKFEVRLDRILMTSKSDGKQLQTLVDTQTKGNFRNEENDLGFHFYVPVYSALTKPRYQYRLNGVQDDWSSWSETASVAFSNLPYGSYLFEVRARMGSRLSANTASYAFEIARPWYLSGIAVVVYFLIVTLGAIGIHRSYRYYYRKRQREIIDSNKKELALAKAQSEKEIVRLKNKQLKKEFRNKNNELAASTLSIIRKNELLGKVKDQLVNSGQKDSADVRNIVKIIDQNLNQTDDWEMFLEAFKHADQKFLKNLKKKHPNLSPNDIKLCAYLRLNLSSKEIAPLLNISPRSVEIKRYRLRKKMDLDHDANLTEYILTL